MAKQHHQSPANKLHQIFSKSDFHGDELSTLIPVNDRIFLSAPDVGERERELLLEAFDSNWIAPLGPQIDALEAEFSDFLNGRAVCALSSGTAALHLALALSGVGPGDDVLTASLTFCATASAITYQGANPVFVDSEWSSWNIDPNLVSQELKLRAERGALPAAVVSVDLYGQCADYDALHAACAEYGVPLIADAAEALGATYQEAPAGTQTNLAVFSFNGNKIITTSGGGLLVGDDQSIKRAKYLATQARQPALHYEHTEIGYNYRMSNLLAAVGRGQLESLSAKVERRRQINRKYQAALSELPLSFMPEAGYGTPTCWLTVALLDQSTDVTPNMVCQHLEAKNIEARPAWKPLHLQPVYADAGRIGGGVAEEIFARGLCLPSGSAMTGEEQDLVIEAIIELFESTQ